MRISDWSSDVCSSDLTLSPPPTRHPRARPEGPGQVTGRLPWILVSSTRMTEGKSGSAWASCLRFSERHALRGAIDAHDAFLVEAVLVGGADVLDGGVLLGGGLVTNHQHGRGLLGDDAAAVAPLAVDRQRTRLTSSH